MFELYLDSADIGQIQHFQSFLPLRGITTNPSILAKAGIGVNEFLIESSKLLGPMARFHVQVVSRTTDEMIEEARQLHALPYDIVVKIPATPVGLAAIKQLKSFDIPLLATAIYSTAQGFMAALAGADYLAPYVNRIDVSGGNGIETVRQLQQLLDRHQPACKILAASFKSIHQALFVMQTGVAAVTLPIDVANQLLSHADVAQAVEQFDQDWQQVFAQKKSFQS